MITKKICVRITFALVIASVLLWQIYANVYSKSADTELSFDEEMYLNNTVFNKSPKIGNQYNDGQLPTKVCVVPQGVYDLYTKNYRGTVDLYKHIMKRGKASDSHLAACYLISLLDGPQNAYLYCLLDLDDYDKANNLTTKRSRLLKHVSNLEK